MTVQCIKVSVFEIPVVIIDRSGPLAQLVEQDPLKVKVLGPIPRRLISEQTAYGVTR